VGISTPCSGYPILAVVAQFLRGFWVYTIKISSNHQNILAMMLFWERTNAVGDMLA